ncbi:hypothetical protein PF010_g11924 [Phytophthora fragariae]|uniref:Uncharacterized protein n=1 Tax=Phytophthora fragariae TaxID=53985 RepID=A0A6G0L483_9STRA|nr:hypothetical protein PF010_g11924 [Phytophthora fragariae]
MFQFTMMCSRTNTHKRSNSPGAKLVMDMMLAGSDLMKDCKTGDGESILSSDSSTGSPQGGV